MRQFVEESINQHIQEEETMKTNHQILTNIHCSRFLMFQVQLLLLFYTAACSSHIGWIIYIIIKHVHTNKKGIISGDIINYYSSVISGKLNLSVSVNTL